MKRFLQREPERADTSAPTVVCLKRSKKTGRVIQDCDYYIGREETRGGWKLQRSHFANPFRVPEDGDIAEVKRKYEAHVRANEGLMALIPTLAGQRLGCWCKQKATDPCHGDVIVKLYRELVSEKRKEQRTE